MKNHTKVAVRCGCCGTVVLLKDFTLSREHCDDCEVQASIEMQHDLTNEEAEEMAHYAR